VEHLPLGEPLIVAAAPHRSWVDAFLLIMALPPLPRLYFLAVAENTLNRWWKRLVLRLAGGMAPVSMGGGFNREGLEISLAILEGGNRLGIFPEGWDSTTASPTEVEPLKRGVAFLSEHSGRRVLPVGLAGSQELWRGKTLRVRVAPPLERLRPGADREEELAYVNRLCQVLQAALPPLPPEPVDGKKPWRWLTRML
jgi:1-acyl-sn-glycerol-3-phosphate acyltransferase